MRSFLSQLKLKMKPKMVSLTLRLHSFLPSNRRFVLAEARVSHADLERVLSDASTLCDFLENGKLQEEYFQVLGRYYGRKKLHRESYSKILEQLGELNRVLPNLANALWRQPTAPMKFEIENRCPTSGRALNTTLWRLYRAEFVNSLREGAGIASAEVRDFTVQEALLALCTGEINSRILKHQENAKSLKLKRKEEVTQRVKLFKSFRENARFRASACFLLYRYLIDLQSNYFFELDDADLVIDFFRQLQQNPSSVLGPEKRARNPWTSLVKSLLPSLPELLLNTTLFPVLMNQRANGKKVPIGSFPSSLVTSFEVRPIHTIWSGIILRDCLGGEITSLQNLTARRWAISGLEGARSFLLERDGAYQGAVRLIPMVGPSGRKIYSFAPAAPIFTSMIITGTELKKKTLVEEWLCQFAKHSGNGIPVAVSESRASDISQLKDVLNQIPGFFLEFDLGRAHDFKIADIRAASFLEKLPLNEGIRQYGEDFIFDATLFDVGHLRLISSTVQKNPLKLSDHSSLMEQKFNRARLNIPALPILPDRGEVSLAASGPQPDKNSLTH
ncbi:MAG: hypothetical protein ACXWQO_06935 [Bdellovibrionota bacterium]